MLRKLLFTILSGAWLLTTAFAATLPVGPEQPYTTIQFGIDAANYGDTVLVLPGTYRESVDFKSKAITVASAGGSAVTVIDAGLSGTVVSLGTASGSPAAILDGFTIQNGFPISGGTNGYGAGVLVVGTRRCRTIPCRTTTHAASMWRVAM